MARANGPWGFGDLGVLHDLMQASSMSITDALLQSVFEAFVNLPGSKKDLLVAHALLAIESGEQRVMDTLLLELVKPKFVVEDIDQTIAERFKDCWP